MVLVMTIASALFGPSRAILAVQILGIGFVLAVAGLSGRVAVAVLSDESSGTRETLEGVVFVATLAYYPLAYWSLLGMETGLLGMLLIGATYLVTRSAKPPRFLLGVLLGLMVWTRPDALLQVGLLWLFQAVNVWQDLRAGDRRPLVDLGRDTAVVIAFVVGSVIARRLYYTEWLPNTYYLKLTGMPLRDRLENGWLFVAPFAKDMRVPLLLAILGLAARFDRRVLMLVVLFVSATVYQVWVGGDPWPYWRIMTPYVPLLLIAAGHGVLAVLWRFRQLVARPAFIDALPRFAALLATAAIAASLSLADDRFTGEMVGTKQPYFARENRRNVALGLELSRILEPKATIGVLYAGSIPYYAGTRAVDFLGKMDKYIARLPADPRRGFNGLKSVPGHNKYDLRYSIRKLLPDYVQTAQWGHDNQQRFVEANYVHVDGFWLLRGSPNVRWELLPASNGHPG